MASKRFLPEKGNYEDLLSYQKALIIYDCTFVFCERFLRRGDRTVDQMVQSARSGKQNILEGAKASVTSAETELKLTNVARASLEELLEDYRDFLRARSLPKWDKDSKEARYVRALGIGEVTVAELPAATTTDSSHELSEVHRAFVHFAKSRSSLVVANILICLINQCNYLLDRYIRQLEETFAESGGLRERMYQVRQAHRRGGRSA